MTEDLLSRSRYALLTGDLSQAETLCRKLIERSPEHSEGLLLLGSIYIKEGKLQSAQKIFETLIELEPDNADAWINLALVNRKRGRLKTALNAAQSAYKLARITSYNVCYTKLLRKRYKYRSAAWRSFVAVKKPSGNSGGTQQRRILPVRML